MRKLLKVGLAGALTLLLSMLSACTGMVQQELDDTHAKLEALQQLIADMNDEMETLGQIVGKLNESNAIIPGSFVQSEEGYDLSFKDGTTIHIPFGTDGRMLIPVGVKNDEDGLYYWTVDGDWLLDQDGNMIQAGATDGIAPEVLVEDGFWCLYIDGKKVATLASCDEMDGIGVFYGIDTSDPYKVVLTLHDGSTVELPYFAPLKLVFNDPLQDSRAIAPGEVLPIPFEVVVEGGDGLAPVITSGTDGVFVSRVEKGETPGTGVLYVQAPDPFSEGYSFLTAWCEGYTAVKVISFHERVLPELPDAPIRFTIQGGTRTIPYDQDYDYTIPSSAEAWLSIAYRAASGTVAITAKPNLTTAPRSCTVSISPKDNPGFVCGTFEVTQFGFSSNNIE